MYAIRSYYDEGELAGCVNGNDRFAGFEGAAREGLGAVHLFAA